MNLQHFTKPPLQHLHDLALVDADKSMPGDDDKLMAVSHGTNGTLTRRACFP